MSNKGFTLIELLTIMGMIGVLSTGVLVSVANTTETAEIEVSRYSTRSLITVLQTARLLNKTVTETAEIVAKHLKAGDFGNDEAVLRQTIAELKANDYTKAEVVGAIPNINPDIIIPNTLNTREVEEIYDFPPVAATGQGGLPETEDTIAQGSLAIPTGNIPFRGVWYDEGTVVIARCQAWEPNAQDILLGTLTVNTCGEISSNLLSSLNRFALYELARDLSPELGGLIELRELRIYLNDNLEIITDLSELPNLERLQIYGNPSLQTPPDLTGLTTLNYLNLNNNDLLSPPDLTPVPNLRFISLRDNPRLTTFPTPKPAGFTPTKTNCIFHHTGLVRPSDPAHPWYNCRYKE